MGASHTERKVPLIARAVVSSRVTAELQGSDAPGGEH